ncbi:hypothetical protein JTE90_029081 [Oedothorax gibbosus]|uniref:Uncharacterized protein n=1 Tax=Oedothorax gibbosus TaxID=931172 RepID=A0AAV6UUZ0_9ARAC|nr:hypothetical protein JTE90_029081 [Oedothorax gibbosus]
MPKLDRSKCLTVEWKIVNASHFKYEESVFNLKGHVFKTETKRCSTLWSTYLTQSVTEGHSSPPELSFGLWDITEKSSELKCEVFLLSTDGEIQIPFEYTNYLYSKKRKFKHTIKKHEIFGNPTLLSQDTLTVHFGFFGKQLMNDGLSMFRTVLHRVDFMWQTKEFEFDNNYLQNTLHEQDTLQLVLSLLSDHERDTHEVRLETQPNKEGFPTIVIAELSITNDRGHCISRETGYYCLNSCLWDIDIIKKSDTIGSLQFRLKSLVACSMECPTLSTQEPPTDLSSTTAEANLLEDVQWEQAMALYCAANSCAVPSLKSRCADILKEGLAVKNACDLLVLADQHADKDLVRCTVDFIRDHREVVSSEEWDKLEASNLQLAAKITRELCLTRKRVKAKLEQTVCGLTKEGK